MSQRVFVRNLGGTPIVIDALEVGDTALGTREVLTANRTLYVRTDGSDSNTGLADTAGGAFLTVQHAVNEAVALDLGIYEVTIQITGAFVESVVLKPYIGSGPITILGDSAVPSAGAFKISSTTGAAISAPAVFGTWVLSGIELSSSASYGLSAELGSVVIIRNLRFGACAAYQMTAFNNAIITSLHPILGFSTAFTVSGNSAACVSAQQQGFVSVQVTTMTVSGTPAYSQAFAVCETNSTIIAPSMTFSGSATGTRFAVSNGSVIYTNGGGANYFPGNAAGTGTTPGVSPYGLYV